MPFVGKDVPSQAAEFAHPEVLIGLTIMAYRYEGLRSFDIREIVAMLKQAVRLYAVLKPFLLVVYSGFR